MNPLNLSIRLPEIYAGALSEYSIGYESPSQTAKRLLMEFLDGKISNAAETPKAEPFPFPHRLIDVENRLNEAESLIEDLKDELQDKNQGFTPDDLERLGKLMVEDIKKDLNIPDDAKALGDRISDLERRANISEQQIKPLEAQYSDALTKLSLWEGLQRQVSKLEKRLAQSEKLIDNQSRFLADLSKDVVSNLSITETAIMIQKKPLDPVLAEITLDHIQASKEFERALTTIKKWSADPNKWPEGWIFDGDKQLWIKTD